LVNERFAYVAGSRMRDGLEVYTDDSQRLESALARPSDKTIALSDRTLERETEGNRGDSTQAPNAARQSMEQASARQELAHGHGQ
jgi:hypothetical protein